MKKRILWMCISLILALCSCGKTEAETNKPVKNQKEEKVEEKVVKVVGGVDVVKEDNIVEMGGILGKLAPIADNLDMSKISKLSESEQKKIIGKLDVLKGKQNTIVENVNEALEGTDIVIDETSGKITMPDNILFGKNKDEISEDGKDYLDTFFGAYAKSILDESTQGYIAEIQVIGNTDTDGTHEYNQDLSERRANAVLNYCLTSEKNGLTEDERVAMKALMVAVGKSYDNPVYDEFGEVDKTASRRVEFNFIMNIN